MRKLDASENSLFMNIPRNYPCVEKKHYNKTGNARLAKLASTVREASVSRQIERPHSTPQNDNALMIRGISGEP